MPDQTMRSVSRASTREKFRDGRKYLILFIVSWNTLVVTFVSSSVLVATPEIAADLNTTPQLLNVTNSGVLLAMGCASLIWSPLAEMFSRRDSYNSALLFMFGASIGTAVAPDMAVFTTMRILSGLTGTYFMVAGQTIIADIFEPVRRGTAVGFMQVGSVAGSAIGIISTDLHDDCLLIVNVRPLRRWHPCDLQSLEIYILASVSNGWIWLGFIDFLYSHY